MATYPPNWAPIDNHPRFKSVPRMGYAAKLAAHASSPEAAGAQRLASDQAALEHKPAESVHCPETTKKGRPCKGMATETGFCAGHSRAKGLL